MVRNGRATQLFHYHLRFLRKLTLPFLRPMRILAFVFACKVLRAVRFLYTLHSDLQCSVLGPLNRCSVLRARHFGCTFVMFSKNCMLLKVAAKLSWFSCGFLQKHLKLLNVFLKTRMSVPSVSLLQETGLPSIIFRYKLDVIKRSSWTADYVVVLLSSNA